MTTSPRTVVGALTAQLIVMLAVSLAAAAVAQDQPAQPDQAGGASIVLDDFSHPAWGVRWSTLEFTRYTPPQMSAGPAGPDGTPSAMVQVPGGGRLLLITQQENKSFDGPRGKLPWVLPGTPRSLQLAARVAAGAPVQITFIVRDSARTPVEARTKPVAVAAGDWTTVQADVPAMTAPVRLVGVELSRAGAEATTAGETDAVMLDDLRVVAQNVSQSMVVAIGRSSYESSPLPGAAVEHYVRVQSLDPAARTASITLGLLSRPAEGQNVPARISGSPVTQQVSLAPGKASVARFELAPPAPGSYWVDCRIDNLDAGAVFMPAGELAIAPRTAAGGAMTGAQCRAELVVFHPTLLGDVEGPQPQRQRLAAAQQPDAGLLVYRTNLSPALLFRSAAPAFKLFEGIAEQGLSLPRYVAVPTRGGARIVRTDAPVDLKDMAEPWLVFFAGDGPGWDKVRIKMRNEQRPAPIDLPWLVVLQRRPLALAGEGGALVLRFGGPAGHLSLLPLHGLRTYTPSQTAQWVKDGLPKAEIQHASTWARRLQRFPLYVKEDFRVDAANDIVRVRQQFEYRSTGPDDWGTTLEPYAPVPPMLALAVRQGLPVRFLTPDGQQRTIADGDVVTSAGPTSGIAGTDDYEYQLSGLLKYMNEDRQPVLSGGGELGDRLRQLIRTQIPPRGGGSEHGEPSTAASRYMPGNPSREDWGIAQTGNSEKQGLLGATIPYLDADEATFRKRTLAVDALYMLNPNNHYPLVDARTGQIYMMEGMVYGRFRNWVDANSYQGDTHRALDYYVRYTGDLDLVRRHWPFLRATFAVTSEFKRHGEWETCCFDTGGGDTWDTIHHSAQGFARLADQLGDYEAYRYACYYFAMHALTLPGQVQMNRYAAQQPYWASMYDITAFTDDGLISTYRIDYINWTRPAARVEDLIFSDIWGENYGMRPCNSTVWMRGSRTLYRMAAELVPQWSRYFLDEQPRKFAPEWYQRVVVEHGDPGDAIDQRTGQRVRPVEGDFAGKINLQARAIVMGETVEQLFPMLAVRRFGVPVGSSDGRVPRIPTYVALLEDGTHQPWVRMYGTSPQASSPDWERGRDAHMDLGEGNYLYSVGLRPNGAGLSWAVFAAPAAKGGLSFGRFGPAGATLSEIRTHEATWNTTIFSAAVRSE